MPRLPRCHPEEVKPTKDPDGARQDISQCTRKTKIAAWERSFDSLRSLRMTPHPPQCAHWGTFSSRRRRRGGALQAEGEDGAAFRAVRGFDLCAHRFGGLFGDGKSNAVQAVLTFIE